jgi:hypothetical protein
VPEKYRRGSTRVRPTAPYAYSPRGNEVKNLLFLIMGCLNLVISLLLIRGFFPQPHAQLWELLSMGAGMLGLLIGFGNL